MLVGIVVWHLTVVCGINGFSHVSVHLSTGQSKKIFCFNLKKKLGGLSFHFKCLIVLL